MVISYNNIWTMKKDSDSWRPQGLVHSKEPSYSEAKNSIINKLVDSRFKGVIVFREPACLETEPESLDLIKVEEDGGVSRMLLAGDKDLNVIFDELTGDTGINQVLASHQKKPKFVEYQF